MNPTRADRVARSIILALFVIAGAAFLAAPVLALNWSARPFPGFVVEQTLVVASIDGEGWSGRQAGLGYPQRIIGIGGQPVSTPAEFDAASSRLSIGDSIEVRAARPDGSTRVYPAIVLGEFPAFDLARLFWLPYGVGLAYVLIGAWVYRMRGKTRPGRAFAFFCVSVALVSGLFFDLSTTHVGPVVWTLAITQIGGALLGLALRFPEEWEAVQQRAWLRFSPYLISIALGIWGLAVLNSAADPWAYVLPWRYSYFYSAVGLAFLFGTLLYRRRRSFSAVARQQARIILWGSLVAFAPIGGWLALLALGISLTFNPALLLPGLLLFPIAIAYAILRYRLFDVDRVLRTGLGYAILTGLVALGYAGLIALLRLLVSSQLRFNDPIPLAIFIFALIVGLDPLRARVQRSVDRLFFRDRIDYRANLEAFARDLTHTLDLSTILTILRERLDATLYPSHILIFLYDHDAHMYVQVGAPIEHAWRFEADSPLVKQLEREEGALTLSASRALPAVSQEATVVLNAIAYVPLRSQERLIGWLALGPRRSGHPYHGDDLAFLAALANQAAVGLEQARLQERALAEQRLRKELELARQIQTSFLPQQLPALPGWEFAAYYSAARQVGGDFYDFISIRNPAQRPAGSLWSVLEGSNLLGLVIADVSDKGIPAALLMAVSKTLVRAVTISGRSPADAIQRVNELLLNDSRAEAFVTLFYGVLDPEQATLRFVNAGHNPPLLVQDASESIFSLRAPGIVLGIFDSIRLTEAEVCFEPGDVLLLYTDGITDALNAQREEFGIERLTRLLLEQRQRPASELLRALVEAIQSFVGETEPFDDMTLVVVKRVR
ncbi:MAG TPA: SpoIIE family protein phosphatase [Anaerolineae bacterium]|nr:SpoIIE family protein phosphatase [Anaerolineae bacterium]